MIVTDIYKAEEAADPCIAYFQGRPFEGDYGYDNL